MYCRVYDTWIGSSGSGWEWIGEALRTMAPGRLSSALPPVQRSRSEPLLQCFAKSSSFMVASLSPGVYDWIHACMFPVLYHISLCTHSGSHHRSLIIVWKPEESSTYVQRLNSGEINQNFSGRNSQSISCCVRSTQMRTQRKATQPGPGGRGGEQGRTIRRCCKPGLFPCLAVSKKEKQKEEEVM